MKPKYNLILLMLFILSNCIAQNKFKYQTFTDSVVKDGFYQINLLPSIVAKSRYALDDIRLFDSDNKQVPYLIKNGEIKFEQNEFVALKKMSEIIDTSAKILVENTNKIALNNLALILKNSLAERSVNISGSYDLKHWYVVKEFINLDMSKNVDDKHFIESIALPNVDYKYLQIVFNGKQQNPMFIEQVGTYKTSAQKLKYFPLPKPRIEQLDDVKKSNVRMIFQEKYNIDKITIFASGVKLFNRNVLFNLDHWNPGSFQKSIIISSQNDNTYNALGLEKIDTLQFSIQNDDNPPLKIDSVKAYQNAYALFAYLKAGQKYNLVFGNDSLSAPVYDIAAFSDSIKNAILLPIGEIVSNQITENKSVVKNKSLSKIWLWTAITTVLLILLYFTSNMLKQINKKQQSEF